MSAFNVFAEYRCHDCDETFENGIAAVHHHMETKHEDYELLGAELNVKIKS